MTGSKKCIKGSDGNAKYIVLQKYIKGNKPSK